ELYRTQLRVLWEWKGGPLALLGRFVITMLVAAVSLILTDWLMADITVTGIGTAIWAVILISLFNAVVRTLVLLLVAPYSLLVTGILVLVFQFLVFLLVAY